MKALYMTDSYARRLETTVKDVEGKNVCLNDTIFYPNGGGQPNDLGTISYNGETYNVTNVFKKNGEIWHEIEREGLISGENVRCEIDWQRRYKLMRMHTAAHILDALFHEKFGALATGNQLGVDKSRIDFSIESVEKEKIQSLVDEANEIIRRGIDVKIYFLKREEALKIPGVIKLANAMPPNVEELRIVEITDIDLQADGGTQVANTKEIGKIVLLSVENRGKNNKRIYYALED